jgi:hypothetical protein
MLSHQHQQSGVGYSSLGSSSGMGHGSFGVHGGVAEEVSFTDEHDDEGYVYHGVQNDTILEHQKSVGDMEEEEEEDEAPQQQTLDPVLFVNSFRHHIERSMALIEREVAMLDTLEKCGSNPLTPANVQSVQSILMERISMASKLQAQLQQHSRTSRR